MLRPLVLIVDDSPDDQLFINAAIAESGVRCRTKVLHSGEEALAFVNRTGNYAVRTYYDVPELILLDIKLGCISGFNVLHDIREDPELRLVPVVILSNSDEPNDIRMAYEVGANGYIRKPNMIAEMKRSATSILTYWLTVNLRFRGAPVK